MDSSGTFFLALGRDDFPVYFVLYGFMVDQHIGKDNNATSLILVKGLHSSTATIGWKGKKHVHRGCHKLIKSTPTAKK